MFEHEKQSYLNKINSKKTIQDEKGLDTEAPL